MPINRAPFNALIDDDGSLTTGSVWHKTAIKDVILDPVDAALLDDVVDVDTSAATGAQNDFAYAATGGGVLRFTGASSVVYSGWANGVNGRRVLFQNLGGGTATFLQASGLSVAANQFTMPSGADLVLPIGALVALWYDGAASRWRVDPRGSAGGGSVWSMILSTTTGVVNDWAPVGLTPTNTVIKWVGTADLTLNGLAGGVLGQTITILNYGTALVRVSHIGAGAVGNKFSNVASSAPTPIATRGFATYIYGDIGGQNGWTLIGYDQGDWIAAPFNAANFVGVGGTWTVQAGDITSLAYRLSGRALTIAISIATTTTTGTNTQLSILAAAFGGFLPAVLQLNAAIAVDVSGVLFGYVQTDVTGRLLLLRVGSSWPVGTDNIGFYGQIIVNVG